MYPNRGSLRFPELVRTIFEFLETDYAFIRREENETYVRYESNGVFVSIFHGRKSYEVGLQIGLNETRLNNGFGIGTLISLYEEEIGESFYYKTASTVDKIEEYLLDLSNLLKKYGDTALCGDRDTFILMRKDIDEYWEARNAVQIKIKASEAFKQRDYKKTVLLYESVSKFLSESERKKLEYARKKSL